MSTDCSCALAFHFKMATPACILTASVIKSFFLPEPFSQISSFKKHARVYIFTQQFGDLRRGEAEKG